MSRTNSSFSMTLLCAFPFNLTNAECSTQEVDISIYSHQSGIIKEVYLRLFILCPILFYSVQFCLVAYNNLV
jgi:hypothetical protein